jgi:hypothetical protein
VGGGPVRRGRTARQGLPRCRGTALRHERQARHGNDGAALRRRRGAKAPHSDMNGRHGTTATTRRQGGVAVPRHRGQSPAATEGSAEPSPSTRPPTGGAVGLRYQRRALRGNNGAALRRRRGAKAPHSAINDEHYTAATARQRRHGHTQTRTRRTSIAALRVTTNSATARRTTRQQRLRCRQNAGATGTAPGRAQAGVESAPGATAVPPLRQPQSLWLEGGSTATAPGRT